ncbi:MAG TPA: S66 peptidase family protein [Fimbriimonas sp.]|nr:S66 peptidase family protein [Fimbriimonas sp.]
MSRPIPTDFQKPRRLKRGDKVAVVSPSSGAAHTFRNVQGLGLRNLEALFGLEVVEFPTSRLSNDELYRNPERRAEDVNRAFADPSIGAVIASIGGDDSVRVLPFLDTEAIRKNPKILMGYSDTTTFTTYLNQLGLVTFNGPSVMAGFAQLRHMPAEAAAHVESILFEAEAPSYRPYPKWADHYVDWRTPGYDGELAPFQDHEGWRWIQGSGVIEGRLFGGCIEVLEFLKGTEFWPALDFFNAKILFLETSEDKPTVSNVKYMLRNYGSMGVLDRIGALLIGRARSYSDAEKEELYETVGRVCLLEFGRTNLPVVANMDFGHTDPQWIMPLGCLAALDCEAKSFRLLEAAVR